MGKITSKINIPDKMNLTQAKKYWKRLTKTMIQLHSFKEMHDLFLDIAARANKNYYYKSQSLPPEFKFFEGKASKTIGEIADEYNLKPKGKNLRICPFHKDTNPSLSLSNIKGLFNCFGCGAKGNLIKFYAMLKEVYPNGNNEGTIFKS